MNTLTKLEGVIKVMSSLNHFKPDSEERKIIEFAVVELQDIYNKRKEKEMLEASEENKIRLRNEIKELETEDLDIIRARNNIRTEGIKELMQKDSLSFEEEIFLNELLDEQRLFEEAGIDLYE